MCTYQSILYFFIADVVKSSPCRPSVGCCIEHKLLIWQCSFVNMLFNLSYPICWHISKYSPRASRHLSWQLQRVTRKSWRSYWTTAPTSRRNLKEPRTPPCLLHAAVVDTKSLNWYWAAAPTRSIGTYLTIRRSRWRRLADTSTLLGFCYTIR